tara:strand:+ start:897 stop:2627 length:1731 start_codon:yes stop_codon:yes gene_type:complete
MLSRFNKISIIISKRRNKQMVFLILLLIIGMVLEIFGLGIILPILAIILDENMGNNYPVLISGINYLGYYNYKEISIFLIVLLPIIYFIKTIFLFVITFYQNKFISLTIRDLSDRLYEKYLSKTYELFIEKNTSEYLKVLNTEILYFTTYLQALITFLTEFALSLAVLLVLLWIEPIGALTVFCFFGILSTLFFLLSKEKLKTWSIDRETIDKSISKILLEGLGNIREIKIFDVLSFFTSKLKSENFKKARITYFQTTLIQAPRFYLEFISVVGLSIFILTFLIQEKNIIELISIIGVFVAGSFRVIPSLNRVITARQHIKYHENTLEIIFNEIKNENEPLTINKSRLIFNKSFELKNIYFKYKNTNKWILDNINLKVLEGESIGIIGESGSGKSSLVDIVSGLLIPQKGKLLIDGVKLPKNRLSNWRTLIGYVSQRTNLFDDTIIANIAFGDRNPNINKVKESIIDAQLLDFVNSLPNGIYSKISENGINFSGGQIQRIAIARALYKNPKVLILDEATSSLDNKTEINLIESVNKLKSKVTIIMIAHRISSLAYCDRIFELSKLELKQINKEKLN